MSRQFVIADDHALFRTGLRLLLSDSCGPAEVREAASLPELRGLLEVDARVDLAVVDLAMPGMSGGGSIRELRQTFPQVPFVVLSGSEQRQDVLDALAAGAFGYIPKSLDPDAMVAAFQQVLGGGIYAPTLLLTEPAPTPETAQTIDANTIAMLTPRQCDVLRLLGKGQANKEIARALDISEGTVKIHLAAIFRLLDVRNRTEAVLKASALDI
ncbi:MAG: response regulator transcription factor [Roseiarcus sp.]|jgi:DNA-binding NarL/FixJ family response regulator